MNPSTEDIIKAINLTPSEIVFVLPNNKNIYMAAKQAEELVSGKKVVIINTVSVPQGISSMLSFNNDAELEENLENMQKAIEQVKTARMTFAERDSIFDNSEIKEGQILGLIENKVKFITNTREECMRSMAPEFADASYITLFYGEEANEEEAQKMIALLHEILGDDKEIVMINGGQPVYYYIISAE
jgi:dihydroxyacetone kinase-like predicted kinase